MGGIEWKSWKKLQSFIVTNTYISVMRFVHWEVSSPTIGMQQSENGEADMTTEDLWRRPVSSNIKVFL